jgi:excisionase family DNA binding protein
MDLDYQTRAPKRRTAPRWRRPRSRPPELPLTITVEEAAELLSMSRSAAYRAVKRGEIHTFRLNGKIKVPTAPLLEMLGR